MQMFGQNLVNHTSGIHSHSSQILTCRSSISCSTFAIVSAKTEGRAECCSSWTPVCPHTWTLWPTFARFWCPYIMAHRLGMTMNFSGSSALGIQKMDHCMQLAPGGRSEGELHREWLPSQDWASQQAWFCGDLKGGGGAKLHATVARSRIKRSWWLQHLGDLILQTCLVVSITQQ